MPNNCEGCSRICCQNFKLTQEITDPSSLSQILKRFPFLHSTAIELMLDLSGKERVVHIFNCERFDPKIGVCKDYLTKERPEFCHNTGNKIIPHSKCLFKNS